jgi:hypothetical protein
MRAAGSPGGKDKIGTPSGRPVHVDHVSPMPAGIRKSKG